LADAARALLAWLAGAGVTAVLGPPVDGKAGHDNAVRVWPLALLPDQALRATGRPDTLRLRVRYLVTADGWGPTEVTPLDRLLVAAANDARVHLVAEAIPADLWPALGVMPQAALQVELPIQVTRTAAPLPRVAAPLRLADAPLVALRGRVLGPGDIPVPGVRVHAAGLGLTTQADQRGEFVLDGVPATGTTRIIVTGKGLRLDQEVAATPQPVELHCELEEV
jgi:hypothetical protein